MHSLLVIADDLTGALDTGAQFAKNGAATRVLLKPFSSLQTVSEPEILVLNTATRHCAAKEAGRVVETCARRYQAAYVYKKTDSTLRGNIGAELESFMNALNLTKLPFIPAYPDLGRTTLAGQQLLHGIPLHETEMARDALNPIRHSFIPDIIRETAAVPVSLVSLRGPAHGASIDKQEREIMVFDCQTNEEMALIAESLREQGLLGASAGCAGFASCLTKLLPLAAALPQAKPMAGPSAMSAENGPLLVLSGSRHPVSVNQVQAALECGLSGITVPAEKLSSEETAGLARTCAEALRRDGVCVMGTAQALGHSERGSVRDSVRDNGEHAELAGRLAALAQVVLEETPTLRLAVFGGDTLLGIMEHLAFDYITPLGEIAPGIVLARAEGRRKTLNIVTKAGAFGERDLIRTIFSSKLDTGEN